MSVRLIKLAVIYLACGMTLGLYMGSAQNFLFRSVHAHINLLGWASLALAALVFHIYPALSRTRLATVWFWLYNTMVPAGLVMLAFEVAGYAWAGPWLGITMTMVWIAGLIFAVNVLWNLRGPQAAGVPAE